MTTVRARILVFLFLGGRFRIKQKTRANEATTNTQRLFLWTILAIYYLTSSNIAGKSVRIARLEPTGGDVFPCNCELLNHKGSGE